MFILKSFYTLSRVTFFRILRNRAIKLVKQDKIQGVLKHLKKNPGPQATWQEAKAVLGRGRGTTLPDCTKNDNPNETAEHQNNYFVSKIAKLVASIPRCDSQTDLKTHSVSVHEVKKLFQCNGSDVSSDLKADLKNHVESVHGFNEEKKPFKCDMCDISCVSIIETESEMENHNVPL